MSLGTTRHSKGCVMLVSMRFGIVLPNFSFTGGSTVTRLINKYEWSNSKMMTRKTLHAQPCASGRCWMFVHNHVGPSMVLYGLIRDDPDFIDNKITINWILSL